MMSTKVHGVIDYVYGLLLILAPFLFGFSEHDTATAFTVIVGLLVLGQAAFTDYEMGLVRRIPMRLHLVMDAVIGAVLIVSPWLFGFAEMVIWPHVIAGLFALVAAGMTQREPSPEWRTAHHH